MKLSAKQKKQLKALAHKLSPMVQVGKNGVNEASIVETKRALNDHELIKIKIGANDKEELISLATEIAEKSGGVLVSTIGRIGIFYKRSHFQEKQKIQLVKD